MHISNMCCNLSVDKAGTEYGWLGEFLNMMIHWAYMFDPTASAWRALILHHSDIVKKLNNYESEAQSLIAFRLRKKTNGMKFDSKAVSSTLKMKRIMLW